MSPAASSRGGRFLVFLPFYDATGLAGAVWYRNYRVYRKWFLAEWVGNLGEHLFYLLAIGFGIGAYVRGIEGMGYAQFIAPGLVVSLAMWTSTFEATFGGYTRLNVQHTYEGMLCTPLSVGDILLGDVLWCATRGAVGAALMVVVLYAFGLVSSPLAPLVLPFVYLEGLAFAALGMVAACLAPSYAFFNFHFSLFITPMFFFSGIFFPLEGYPAWVRWVSDVLPLTHAVRIARGFITTGDLGGLWLSALYLLAMALAFFSLARWLLERKVVT